MAITSDENSALIWMIVPTYVMYHLYLTLLKIFLHIFYFKQCDRILPRCNFLCIFLLVVWWACWISEFICHWVLEIFSHYIFKCFFCFILLHLCFFLLSFQFPICWTYCYFPTDSPKGSVYCLNVFFFVFLFVFCSLDYRISLDLSLS